MRKTHVLEVNIGENKKGKWLLKNIANACLQWFKTSPLIGTVEGMKRYGLLQLWQKKKAG